MAFVLDRSGSMSGARMEALRRDASAAVAKLAPSHQLSVIVFDSMAKVLLPLSPIGNGSDARAAIQRITPAGGTHGHAGLMAALDQLRGAPEQERHIVFLTDGQMPTQGMHALVTHLAACDITVSTIGLGGSLDRKLLSELAGAGRGRFVEVADAAKMSGVLSAELSARQLDTRR